jgi:hypothetical protein
MPTPNPATTNWVPVGPSGAMAGLGFHTSSALGAANADLTWSGGASLLLWDNVNPSAGGYSIRSYGAPPAGVGTRLVLRSPFSTMFTVKHNLTGGSGVPFWIQRGQDAYINPGDTMEFHYTGTAWMEMVRGFISDPKITYGTTLPTSPADGDIAILVDSLTLPNYSLSFRYNNGSTVGYKWEYIGGTAITVNVDGLFTSASLIDVGSAVTVPYNGNFFFDIVGTLNDNSTGTGSWAGMVGYFWDRTAGAALGSKSFQSYANQSSAWNRNTAIASKQYVANAAIGGHSIGIRCQNSNNTTQMELYGARLTITPRMIG